MPRNTKSTEVGGFAFQNRDEADQARREIDGIRHIKTKTDKNDPETMLQLYNKMIEQRLFETAVGYSYLKEMQEYLVTIPSIKNEDILPIPVTHPKLEESLRKQRLLFEQREKKRVAKEKERRKTEEQREEKKSENLAEKLKMSRGINLLLAVCIVIMFIIELTSDSPTILDYQSKLLNRYAAWEQELTEREQAVTEKERELGIKGETGQTDFTQ